MIKSYPFVILFIILMRAMVKAMNFIWFFKKILTFYRFITHNNKIFYRENLQKKNNNEILVEFNNFYANHIGISYLANILKKKYHGKIVAYYGHVLLNYPLRRNFYFLFKFHFSRTFGFNFFSIYKSFGAESFLYPDEILNLKKTSIVIFKNFLKKTNTLKKLLKFRISNVLVGDLIYDTYLKKNYHVKPTIELKSKDFKIFLKDFINLFIFWENYIKKNKVKAIIGSHSVYSLAIPLRIGLKYKIESFVLTPEYLQRLKSGFIYQNIEVHYLKKIFKSLKENKRKEILNSAKKIINQRSKGIYSSHYPYVTTSPFGSKRKEKIIKDNKKIKLLIATHDFVDAPHCMGDHLFPDFYLWFLYLCKLSKKTNYSWYVKTHPNFGGKWSRYIEYERKVVKEVLKDFPHIILLPEDITHNQIASEKINAVFTVNGTVAMDYALLNVHAVNASLNTPYINYNFTHHPKNITELRKMILNIKKITKLKKIKKKEIIEFYAVKNIFFSKNWLFHNYEKTLINIGSYHDFWRPKMYNYWIDNFELNKHLKINKDLETFVNSNNIYLLNNNNAGKF